MADRRVQIRGSQMKLIDILRDIKNTKKELKSILDENNDFARYPITIHNVLAEIYNRYYVNGFHDMWEELTGESKYCESPRAYIEYIVDDKNYDPWTTEGLTDIMSDVCGYRVEMKNEDKLNTESDYFPSYPSLLRIALTEMENLGYEDGQDEAYSIIYTEPPTILQPTFEWDSTTNTFTMSTTQENVTMWYMIGNENSPKMIYTNPVELNEDVTIFYYASIGKYKSEIYSYDCDHNIYHVAPRRAPAGPTISFNGGATITINSANSSDQIYYAIGQKDADKILYRGAFDLPANTNTVIYAWAVNGDGWSETSSIGVQTWTSAPGITSEGWSGTTINGVPVIQYQCASPEANYAPREATDPFTWTITCDTEDATIYYMVVEGTAIPDEWTWTEYDGPITLNVDGTLYAYAAADGYTDSQIVRYTTYAATAPVVVKPNSPTFRYRIYDDGTAPLYLECSNQGTGLMYSYGPPQNFEDDSSWMTYEGRTLKLQPDFDCVVYAKSFWLEDPTIQSDYVTYEYKNYYTQYDIQAPVMTRINNTITIEYVPIEDTEGEYEIWYTTNGSDPKTGRKWGFDENRFGIPITQENTVIKAVVKFIDTANSNRMHWGKIATEVFSPEEGVEAYKDMFFTVRGATEINITQNGYNSESSNNNFSWSYDLQNWNTCYYWSVTGLDPTRNVYIFSTQLGYWRTMTFGADDQVTVSGNILTLVYGQSFKDSLDPNITIEIPTEWKNSQQFYQLFKGATSLVDASNLYIPDFECKGKDFEEMFMGCTALKYGPTFLPKNIGLYSCKSMFEGCTSLLSLKSLTINTIRDYGCQSMFSGCKELLLGGEFELSTIGECGMQDAFLNCEKLLDITLTLSGDMTSKCFQRCFKNCSSMNSDQIHLNSINVADYSCEEMFMNCSALTSSTSLNSPQLANSCYSSMFEGCASLNTVGQIAAISGAMLAMKRMFAGCLAMTTAPTLRFPELRYPEDRNMMYQMFDGCELLNYIKVMWLTDPITGSNEQNADWTRQWVRGVAASGTFEMDEDAEWLHIGENAIPRGWRVIGALNVPGVITNIVVQNMDEVVITASNDDDVYYWFNSNVTDIPESAHLYTEPFVIDHAVTVYACCLNNRGTRGPIYNQNVIPVLPEIIFSRVGNYVALSSDPQYDAIYWRTSRDVQYNIPEHLYTEEIQLTENCYLRAWGVTRNGTQSEQYLYNFTFDLGIPTGNCENNIVTLTLPSGSPERTEIVYYSYAPSSSDKGSLHTYNTPFVITEDRVIEAHVRWFNGTQYVTNEEALIFTAIWDEEGYSYVLDIPVFKRKNDIYNKNRIYCTYGQNKQYAEQIPSDIHVYYKINNGTTQEWIFKNSLQTSYGTQIVISEDSDIETWATDGVQTTAHYTYHFDYIPEQTVINIPAPTIELVKNGNDGMYFLYVRCSDPQATCYFYDTINRQKKQMDGQSYSMRLGNFDEITIYAWAIRDGFESDTVSETYNNTEYIHIYPPLSITYDKTRKLVEINPDLRNDNEAKIYYNLYKTEQQNPISQKYYNGSFFIDDDYYVYAWTFYNGSSSSYIMKYCAADVINDYLPEMSRSENIITISGEAHTGIYYEYSLNGVTFARFSDDVDIELHERETITVYARSTNGVSYSDVVMNTYTFDPQYTEISTPVISYNNTTHVVTITSDDMYDSNFVLKYKINDGNWNNYTGSIQITADCTVYARNYYYDNRYSEAEPYEITGILIDPELYWEYDTYNYFTTDTTNIQLINPDNLTIVYSSSDNSIATIDQNGDVTLIDDGTCILTAYFAGNSTYKSKTVTCTLNVEAIVDNAYLTFSSDNTFTVRFSIVNEKTWSNKLEYSKNLTTWTEWNGEEIGSSTLSGKKYLYLRGYKNTKIDNHFIINGSNISCDGDIRALLNYTNLEKSRMDDFCFYLLFRLQANLIKAPELPAMVLGPRCYYEMFYGCTSLTTAPELPATTLAPDCYYGMFDGCTSLTTAPSLPATTLKLGCYYRMFRNCTSLTTAPTLPATKIFAQCYQEMFSGCINLIAAPELLATTLADSWDPEGGWTSNSAGHYARMFYNCTKINYIKMMATDITYPDPSDPGAYGPFDNWVHGVSETGTIVKSSLTTLPEGDSGIPIGWTIENV